MHVINLYKEYNICRYCCIAWKIKIKCTIQLLTHAYIPRVRAHTHTHTHTHVHRKIHTHANIYTHTYTLTHMHVYINIIIFMYIILTYYSICVSCAAIYSKFNFKIKHMYFNLQIACRNQSISCMLYTGLL